MATYLLSPEWEWKRKSHSCVWLLVTLHGILQGRILEWVTYPFSSESSWPRNRTVVASIAGGFFTSWSTREARILSPGSSQTLTLTRASVPVALLAAVDSLCLMLRFSTHIPYTPTKLFSSCHPQSLNLLKVSLFSFMSAHSNSRPCSNPVSFKVWISVAFHLHVQKRNHSFLPYVEHLVPMPCPSY